MTLKNEHKTISDDKNRGKTIDYVHLKARRTIEEHIFTHPIVSTTKIHRS